MKKILVSFIQDRSGSMSNVWQETLSGFKTYVEGLQADQQKDNEVEYLFSLTTFDTQIETPHVGAPIASIDPHVLKQHGPRGGTALYDAVGKTLQAIDDDKNLTFDKAIVVIVTDGEENSSREWKKDDLHAAIDERVKRGNWTFTYLGTQPETWDDAQRIGVGAGASANYNAQNAHATYATMATASVNMARSAMASSRSFLHDNLSRSMRASVGMKTKLDDEDDKSGLGHALSSLKPPPVAASRPVASRPGSRTPSNTTRRWK